VDALPTGTVTFLFTDLESSTRLWEEHPEAMRDALARHDALLREAIEARGGHVVKSTGDGLHAVFVTAGAAVEAAVAGQMGLGRQSWGEVGPLRVRMALHTGIAEQRGGDYFGPVLNRVARLVAVAHPGQVLCSQATADLVRDSPSPPVTLLELGRHRLRDLARPELVFQVADPELPGDFPPLRSVDAFPGNLPTERTTLIGRTRELASLAGVLEQHRLVTLTGVGGVGKTRLAVQLAANVLDRLSDGAWLVALASIRDPALVPSAVAAALEIVEHPGRPVTETLCDAIGSRELLLVLDNCEHLIDATARLVDVLLDACSALRIVATSREALGVEGEQTWPTPSLRLPARDGASLVDVAQTDAVALFVERARAVRPDFELSPANANSVTALCSRLDGIPLAIELAAARISALGPQDILERVDRRFLLLTGGSRTALERHQTLQAAVDWSYDLLEEREQRFFERLSVFAGGFSLEGAQAVAAEEGDGELEVLDLLGSLVAKSMVVAEGSGASVRYRLLETLQQYGRDRLAATGEVAGIRGRHAQHFLEFVEGLRPMFFSPDQVVAWDRMSLEIDNWRAAFAWILETGDAAAALRMAAATFAGWHDTGEMLRFREAALAAATGLPEADLVEPLAVTAWSALQAGEHTLARDLAEGSLTSAGNARLGPHELALEVLGLASFWRNDPEGAIAYLEQSVSVARDIDDGSPSSQFRLGNVLGSLAFVLAQAGAIERAIAIGEEAVDIARKLRVPTLLSGTLFNLALAYRSADPERAAHLLDESLESSIGARWPYGRSWVLLAAGQVRAARGDHAGALEAFVEVLTLSRKSGERFIVPIALQGMARALRQVGRLSESARLLGASQGLAERLAIPGASADVAARDRAAVRLRQLLGDEQFEAEWEAGRAMSFEAATRAALQSAKHLDDDPARSAAASLPHRNQFHCEGDTWTITYDGRTVRLRDAKGLRYIARLLAEPGREVHVNDLAARGTGGEAVPASGSGGEVLDASAKADYRQRLAELEAEVAEATEWNDTERVGRAQAEIDALTDQLTGAYGLGGRARTMSDPVERVRKAVTNRIRDSLDRIAAEHKSLGRHLANSVRTGTFCSYTPEGPTAWEL
jgi:predicted ATPase/class 3 adenylate cyclase